MIRSVNSIISLRPSNLLWRTVLTSIYYKMLTLIYEPTMKEFRLVASDVVMSII